MITWNHSSNATGDSSDEANFAHKVLLTDNPSSWYKPTLCFPFFSPKICRICQPLARTFLRHQSYPSSRQNLDLFFFIHIYVLLNTRHFLESIMVLISSSLIFTKVFVFFAYKNLMQFGNNLLELIKNVKLKKIKNKFLDQLYKNISYINKSENVFIFVDKTCNIHEIDTNTYSKLLMDNISNK